MKRSTLIFSITLLLVAAGCTSTGRFIVPDLLDPDETLPPDSTLSYTVYLIGDAGNSPPGGTIPPVRLLDSYIDSTSSNAAVVFLGDNAYPSGLPPEMDPGRELAEHRLLQQIDAVKDMPGQVVFIPGNHDWGHGGMGGNLTTLRRQELFIERTMDRGNVFLPDRGFPGPVEVELSDELVLIVLDTQWWLEPTKIYGDTGQYELEQEGEFLLQLHYVLERNAGKKIIVAAHHPLFTNSSHAGRFPEGKFFRPLYSVVRRYLGTPQDLSNLKYRRLRDGLLKIFERHEGLVYAAGHDHNLQYFQHENQHYIISGSGSKLSYVAEGLGEAFAAMEKGFAILRYYTDGSIWIEFVSPVDNGETGKTLYLNRIQEPTGPLVAFQLVEGDTTQVSSTEPLRKDSEGSESEITDRTNGTNGDTQTEPSDSSEPYDFHSTGSIIVAAGKQYSTSEFARLFLGERYRELWKAPIRVPIIDLEKTAGGLTPLQIGGGLQTKSLRLKGGDGDEYVLRSINKDPTASVPEYLRGTIAHDVVQDQISAIHPYGAFILPQLAEAAGIYHTAPHLVYIPDDERLGIFRDDFAGTLALFEIRPDEEQTDEARLGYAENVIGSAKLFEEIEEDNDERVDERAFARARLFDMLIGDWDRHSDQWRWAEFDVTPGKIYRPIPRDRDFAFFKFDGLLAMLSRWYGNERFRRYTNFKKDYGSLIGLNFNGALLDRRFTSSLTREDWIEIADSIRMGLSDNVIENAIREWPEPVFEHHGEEIIDALEARRDKLTEAASEYYDILAHTVDIVGSNKHERFEVTRIDDERTEVVMYKTKKEGDIDRELLRRTFFSSETDEIRLYGLGGEDRFIITGEVGDSPTIRAIGGLGEDQYVDNSLVEGKTERTIFYDTETGNEWEVSEETRVYRSNDPIVNSYSMRRFERDTWRPVFAFGVTKYDGILLGGGVRFSDVSFRKMPYAATHQLVTRASPFSQRYELMYAGHFIRFYREWDLAIDAEVIDERNFRHYFGFGNETSISDREQYRAKFGFYRFQGDFVRAPLPFTTVSFGPIFQMTNIDPLKDNPKVAFTDEDLVDKYYAGVHASLNIDGTDSLAATESGMRWLNDVSLNFGIRNTDNVYLHLASELSYFYTFDVPGRLTLGFRLGGATNIGSFSFYQANTLGGSENLRGYRRTRYWGRSNFYANTDLRARLFDFNAYITRGEGGVLGFFDVGRVWADDEKSGKWHPGIGGGLWMSPHYRLVFTGTVGFSPDDTVFDFSVGFLF